jgi:hypothetical protein
MRAHATRAMKSLALTLLLALGSACAPSGPLGAFDSGSGHRDGSRSPAATQAPAIHGEWVVVNGEVHGQAISEASLPLLRISFDEAEAGWTIPGYPQRFRYTRFGAPDSIDFHLPAEQPHAWLIPVRSALRGDTLDLAFSLVGPFHASEGEPPARPSEADLNSSGPHVRLSLVRASEAPSPNPALTEEEERAAEAVEASAIERMTRALVTPEMEGRGSGQPGGERAAHLIADWFGEAGLEPPGKDGFLQRVPFFSGRAAPNSSLTIGDTTFHVGCDFAIASLPMRTRPAMSADITGEVVLFGPSLGSAPFDAPLPALDVRGKIVAWSVMSTPDDGTEADLFRTYEALHRSGAEAIIVLLDGPLPEPLLRTPLFDGIHTLDVDLYGSRAAPPVLFLGPQAYAALFGDGSKVRDFIDGLTPSPPPARSTGKEIRVTYEIEETTTAPTYNVAGVIHGRDPDLREEAVVFTAHHDALGVHDGAIYAGAADNALGIAEMVEIARAIQESGVRPRRSIVFLAVGAEERGLLGTLHWMRNPTWPLDRVVANINIDGGDAEVWGALHGVIDLTRHAALADAGSEVAAAMGLPLLPNDRSGGLSSSDFYDFLRAGIPAIQLMGIGGDPAQTLPRMQRYFTQRIHGPDDLIDDGWEWAGPRQMAQLYLLLGLRVANADESPEMRPHSPYAPSAERGTDSGGGPR